MSNVVLLMSDEHNPFVSSFLGHPAVQTPNMDRLARQGTVFENAYCPSPLCMPCRSAFMSGRRVHEIQAYNNCPLLLNQDQPTYGAVLDRQGVHTVHIGKLHVYAPHKKLAFSECILPMNDDYGPGDSHLRRKPLRIRTGAHKRADGFGPRPGAHDDDLQCVDAAIDWLKSKAPALKQPWVLVVQVVAPHFPHFTSQELWDLYPNGGDLPLHGREQATANHPYAQDLRRHFETDQFTEEQVRGLRRGYLSCVTFVDRQLGRIMDAIERGGRSADTDVIYTSDHGEMLGKFGMWWKCTLFEDSARVPLLAAGPDFKRNTRVATPVDLLDLQASLFAATGAERPGDWHGTALQKIEARDDSRVVFSEYHGHGTRSGSMMVRKGAWKLIWFAEAPHLLFNLENDPHELNNLYDRESKKAAELEKHLREFCNPERECQRAHEFEARQHDALAALK